MLQEGAGLSYVPVEFSPYFSYSRLGTTATETIDVNTATTIIATTIATTTIATTIIVTTDEIIATRTINAGNVMEVVVRGGQNTKIATTNAQQQVFNIYLTPFNFRPPLIFGHL